MSAASTEQEQSQQGRTTARRFQSSSGKPTSSKTKHQDQVDAEQDDLNDKLCADGGTRSESDSDSAWNISRSGRKSRKRKYATEDSDDTDAAIPSCGRKKAKTNPTKNSTPKSSRKLKESMSNIAGSDSNTKKKTPLKKPDQTGSKKSPPKENTMSEFAGVLGLSPMKNGEHSQDSQVDGGTRSQPERSLLSTLASANGTSDSAGGKSKKNSPKGADLIKDALNLNSRSTPDTSSPGPSSLDSPEPTSVKKKRGRPRKTPLKTVTLEDTLEESTDCVLELKEGNGVPMVLLEEWEENMEAGLIVDCQICTTNFDSVGDVTEHYRGHHAENSRTTASADLSESLVKDGYERILPKALKNLKAVKSKYGSTWCKYCNVLVQNHLDLAVVHHLQCDVIESPLTCHVCSAEFSTRVGIRAHYMYKHTIWYDVDSGTTADTLSPLLRHFGFIRCQTCGGALVSVKAYKHHVEACDGSGACDGAGAHADHDGEDSVTPARSSGRPRKTVKYELDDSSGSESESTSTKSRKSTDKTVKKYLPGPEQAKHRRQKEQWIKKVEALFTKPDPCAEVPQEYMEKYSGNRKKILPCPKKCGRSLGSTAALKYHYPRCGETSKKFEMSCLKCGARYSHYIGMRQHVIRCHGLVNPFDAKPVGNVDFDASLQRLPNKRQRKKVVYSDEKYDMAGSGGEDEVLDDDRDEDFKGPVEPNYSSDEAMDDSLLERMPVRHDGRRLTVPYEGLLSRGTGADWTYQRCKAFKENMKLESGTANLRPELCQFVRAEPSLVPDLPGCPAFRLEALYAKSTPGVDVPSLPLFQSVTTTVSDTVSTCYMNVGAPAFYTIWRTNSEPNSNKYFLLHTLPDYEEKYGRNNLVPHRGLFQVWDCGPLGTECKTLEPKMVLSLVHDWGIVLDMRWNAFSIECFEQTEAKTLGYVLVASGDGVAKVFSVPESLLGDRGCWAEDYKEKCYEVKPCAELVLGESDPTANPCMSCDWCLHGNEILVAIGYRKGIVALYDLSTQSPLLVTMETATSIWRPYKTFWAHTKEVRRLRFSPLVGRILVTAGAEQKLNIWHLDDVHQGPVHTMMKGYVTDLDWSRLDFAMFFSVESTQRLNGVYTCMLDEGACSKTTMSLGNRRLLAPKCAATSVDHSDWLCTTVGGTAEGDVTGNVMSALTPGKIKYRENFLISKTEIRPIPGMEQTAPEQRTAPEQPQQKQPRRSQSESSEDSLPPSGETENDVNEPLPYLAKSIQEHKQLGHSYDLVFQDNHMVSRRTKTKKSFDEDEISLESLDAYAAKTVFKVCWNPNRESCHWLLVARQCGLVSLHNLSGCLPKSLD